MSDKLISIDGAQTLYNDLRGRLKTSDTNIVNLTNNKVDWAYVSEDGKYLHLTSNGEDLIGPLGPFSGGGGGGGSSAKLTVTNTTGWKSKKLPEGSACVISLNWSSIEEDEPTGPGTIVVKVNSLIKQTVDAEQGDYAVDVSEWLVAGDNNIIITVSDIYNNSKSISYTVSLVAFSLTSTFDAYSAYEGDITFTYTPTGEGAKTVYFFMDGEELTETVVTTERQQTFIIPAQSHGSHKFEVYFKAIVEGSILESNHLYYDLICIEEGKETPIIASDFRITTASKYDTLNIPYIIYTPNNLMSEATLKVDGVIISELANVDRSLQTWSYVLTPDIPEGQAFVKQKLEILSGNTTKTFNITVNKSSIDIHAVTEDLELYLTSKGRSNNEANPAVWKYEDIEAEFTNFNWKSDGWIADNTGAVALKVQNDGRVNIPFKIFENDFRSTGKTIEFEFSTSEVNDYDATVISCWSGNRGLNISAQKVLLASEQLSGNKAMSTQFKEDEHIRVSFVVNKLVNNRLVYCYINGVVAGMVQYNQDDNWAQATPVNITIGSNLVTTNIYNIRVYKNDLTRYDMVNNWIADMQSSLEMIETYNRNNIYDKNGNIVISKLPKDLPYMVLEANVLPQYKGDKRPVSGYYVDPRDPEKSFSWTEAEANVQGTSSQYYPRKNYKISFKKAKDGSRNFTWTKTKTGEAITSWAMNDEAIPVNAFTFKADFASSEGCNNVELIRLYNDICPYKTPAQKTDIEGGTKHRQGIDGFPIVIFWNNGEATSFLGKYNFNNDKGNENVFGFSKGSETIPNDESWETLNNTSERVRWMSDDFGTYADWKNDYESRFPDYDNPATEANITKLHNLATWVVSTNPDKATGNPLPEPVTYGTKTYIVDDKYYRLDKFKYECADHFVLDDLLFYYLYTEMFLLVDSRAKNSFPTLFNEDGKWAWLPYDMDTAIGINNEGKLAFTYSLEDYGEAGKVGGEDVFNAQDSVLWNNVRKCFPDELASKYESLRSKDAFSYEGVEQRFEDHQYKWPAAIFNEDAYFKYVKPLVAPESGVSENYLEMCLGSKAEQRKWWLYNRFRYVDSKYNTGYAKSNYISFRSYNVGEFDITPYADIYASVLLGSYPKSARAPRNQVCHLATEATYASDTETAIYSADQLKDVGDLSVFKPGTCNVSMATRLQKLKVGCDEVNEKMTTLTLGDNILLKDIDARNCPNLPSLDTSRCASLEKLYLDGSGCTGVSLPQSNSITHIHLPATLTNFTMINQQKVAELVLEGTSNLTTLRLESVSNVVGNKILSIISTMADGSRVRLINFAETFNTLASLKSFITHLNRMSGLDEKGYNVPIAQVLGTLKVLEDVSYEYIAEVQARYPNISFDCNVIKTVEFYDWNGETLLDTKTTTDPYGTKGSVVYGGVTPTKADTDKWHYVWNGWSTEQGATPIEDILNNIDTSKVLYATFKEVPIWTVNYYKTLQDGSTTLVETDITRPDDEYQDTVYYNSAFPEPIIVRAGGYSKEAPFIGWSSNQYGNVDIISIDNRTITNVSSYMEAYGSNHILNIYAAMDWPIRAIDIAHLPDKVKYYVGESLDTKGLKVVASKITPVGEMSNIPVTVYDYEPKVFSDPAEGETVYVTVSIADETVQPKQFEVGIGKSIAIKKHPDRYFWKENEAITLNGIILTTTFNNSWTEDVPYSKDIECIPSMFTTTGSYTISVNYKNLSTPMQVLIIRNIDRDNLDNNSWELISAISSEGTASNYWHIGQQKKVYIIKDYGKGFLTGAKYFRILGFDHNKELESPNQHTITFGLATGYTTNEVEAGLQEIACYCNAGGFAQETYTQSWNKGCNFKTYCDKFFYDILPDTGESDPLKPYIKTVIKGQSDQDWTFAPTPEGETTKSYWSEKCLTQQNKLFVPSLCELFGVGKYSDKQTSDEFTVCKQFDYYKYSSADSNLTYDPEKLKKCQDLGTASKVYWWTRSFVREYTSYSAAEHKRLYYYYYGIVDPTGNISYTYGSQNFSMVPCFNV